MVQLSPLNPDLPLRRNLMRHYVVKPGKAERFIFLDDEVLKVETHFIGNRTRPCLIATGVCEGCEQYCDVRPGLFISVIPIVANSPHLFIFTENAWADAQDIRAMDGKLRGKVMEAQRIGAQKNSPMRVKLVEHSYQIAPGCELPRPNILIAMAKLWKLPDIQIGERQQRIDDFPPDAEIPLE